MCDNSLMTGFVYEKHRIVRGIVRYVIRDMEGPAERLGWKAVFLPAVVILILAGALIAWWGGLSFGDRPLAGEGTQNVFRGKVMKALEITSLERSEKAAEAAGAAGFPGGQGVPSAAAEQNR